MLKSNSRAALRTFLELASGTPVSGSRSWRREDSNHSALAGVRDGPRNASRVVQEQVSRGSLNTKLGGRRGTFLREACLKHRRSMDVALTLTLVGAVGGLSHGEVSPAAPMIPCSQQSHVIRFLGVLKRSYKRESRAALVQDAGPLYYLSAAFRLRGRDEIDDGVPLDSGALLKFASAKGIRFRSLDRGLDALVPREVLQKSLRERAGSYYQIMTGLRRAYASQHSSLKCMAGDGHVLVRISDMDLFFYEITFAKRSKRARVTSITHYYGAIPG
jgi:hypothetical protein